MAFTVNGWTWPISPTTQRSLLHGFKPWDVRKGNVQEIQLIWMFFFPNTITDSGGPPPQPPPAPHPAPHFSVRGPLSLSLLHFSFTITLTSEGIKKCLQTAHFSKNKNPNEKAHRTCLSKEKNYISFSVFRHHSPNNCYMQVKFLNRCGMGLDMKFRSLLY